MQNMGGRTNLYTVQCDPHKTLNATCHEMEQFIGICFYMSIYGLPGARLYRNSTTRVDCVADVMLMHRWEAMKGYIHFSDNLQQIPLGTPGHGRLYKARPLLSSLLECFKRIPMKAKFCVNEQIVPFKEKNGLKQYNPKKTKRWGYKICLDRQQWYCLHL